MNISMFVSNLPEWTSDDASSLKSFLESPTGQRAVQTLAYLAPALLDGADVNRTLVASGEVKGYSEAIQNLFALQSTRPVEPSVAQQYPSLDDESQWTPPIL